MSDFDGLMKKVMSDPAFCKDLITSPEQTLRANGVEPTPAMVSALAGLTVENVQSLVSAFGNTKAAAA
jgi:hypothetical protein